MFFFLLQAFTLYNSANIGGNEVGVNKKAWNVVHNFLGNTSPTTHSAFNLKVKMLHECLQKTRTDLSDKIDDLDRSCVSGANEMTGHMRAIVVKSNDMMINLTQKIIEASIPCMTRRPPCSFSVVGVGSIGRGEATPFSDLEYLFLIEDGDEKPYFERLAVVSYFFIGALKETNLKIADVEELNGWFVDKRRCGFQIDGITESSGNVPTGHGYLERQNEFIVTPDELVTRYQMVLESPEREKALRGDLTAMLAFTALIYTNQEQECLLKKFTMKRNSLNLDKNQSRNSIDQEMLENDLRKFTFSPEYDIYSCGFSLNLKKLVYRFPSIVVLDIGILVNVCGGGSWEALDSLRLLTNSQHNDSFLSELSSLLLVACFTRLRCYLVVNSNSNPFQVSPPAKNNDKVKIVGRVLQFKEDTVVWKMVCDEFRELARSIISLQQHLIGGRYNAFNIKDLKAVISNPLGCSSYVSFLAHYYCCEWSLALRKIPSIATEANSLAGSPISQDISALQAIAFTFQQCRMHTEALSWYNKLDENPDNPDAKQLVSVFLNMARCYFQRSDLSEAHAAFQKALATCGIQDVGSMSKVCLDPGVDCLDVGYALLEMGCFSYKTEESCHLALHYLFKAMEFLILDAANLKQDKCSLLPDLGHLPYDKRLAYTANCSRPLAHCLYAIAELLHKIENHHAKKYYSRAHKMGLKLVVDQEVDDIDKASILLDLGRWFSKCEYLRSAWKILKERVPENSSEQLQCNIMVSIGEVASASINPPCDGDDDDELTAEKEELKDLMDNLPNRESTITSFPDNAYCWTQQQLDDWYQTTTKSLKNVYQQEYHLDLAKVHKIRADVAATSMDDSKDAKDCYEKAKVAFREVGSNLGVAAVNQAEANLFRKKREYTKAEDRYSDALKLFEIVFAGQTSNTQVAKVLEERAENLRHLERDKEAKSLTTRSRRMVDRRSTMHMAVNTEIAKQDKGGLII